jgi:hypothetical protein
MDLPQPMEVFKGVASCAPTFLVPGWLQSFAGATAPGAWFCWTLSLGIAGIGQSAWALG